MAASPDPFETYLKRAAALFDSGDIVQAGQIWQAILKKKPDHEIARAGLYKVKLHFDARATQGGLVVAKAAEPASPASESDVRATAGGLPVPQDPEIVRLLEQGCTLYDAGHLEDALNKWVQVLAKDPNNVLAKGYITGARRTLGDAAVAVPPAPEAPPAPAPAPLPVPAVEPDVDVERLLRDGCTLFDMGQTEDALKKWEEILAHDPAHALARAYVQDARRDLGLPPLQEGERPVPAPTAMPSAAPVATSEPIDEQLEKLIRDGVQLYDMGMVSEAQAKWQQVLDHSPGHREAEDYLAMARRDQQAAPPSAKPTAKAPAASMPNASPSHGFQGFTPVAPAAPLELAFEEPLAKPAAPAASEPEPPPAAGPAQPVAVPSALTTGLQKARNGFNLAETVQRISLPGWVASPVFILGTITGVVVIVIGSFYYAQHRKDTALRQAVASFRATATAPVARNAAIPTVQLTADALRRDAESSVSADPLLSYFLAQELTRLEPGDAAAAQLLDRAKAGLAEGLEPVTLADFERQLKEGELEAADRSMVMLLRQSPDDVVLRERAARLCGVLAQAFAAKERWSEAEELLRRAQAMFPADRSWAAKSMLLSGLRSLPKRERTAWIQLLS